MDRLINKKRLGGHSTVSEGPHLNDASQHTGSSEKRSRNQPPGCSSQDPYAEGRQLPIFVPNSYKEVVLRKVQSDNEFGLPSADIPNDCEAALLYINNWFPKLYFGGRLPSIILSSQLNSILQESSIMAIESQLKSLVYANKIIVFPTFSGSIPCSSKSVKRSIPVTTNYLIVFYEDFVNLQKHQKDPLFQNFIANVLPYQSTQDLSELGKLPTKPSTNDIIKQVNLLRLIPKPKLVKLLNIQDENDLRRLVNAGYLGIHDRGNYCLSLPGAGEFIKVLEKGRKVVLASIRKAKFGEILQQELERRPLSKTAPLGVQYHLADLMGSSIVERLNTTSGPLLRIKRL